MSVETNEANEKQEETAPSVHRVVVFGVPDDTDELGQLLIDHAGMDAATAKLAAHSLPGLLPRTMTQHQAADVATEIRGLGVSATAVPASEVPNLSQAHQTHHVRLTDESLQIVDVSDHLFEYPWENVQIVSVGVVPSTAPLHHRPASALSMGSTHHSWNDGAHLPSKRRPEAFVVLNSGPALILASDEMNYEYLGSRIATSSRTNFARMVDDLVKHAPTAWVTPSTRAFQGRGPLRHYEFRSRDDFRHYTEFQILVRGQLNHQH